MLEQVNDALWIAEGETVSFYGAPYPTRCVIVRLENSDLWLWSPVKLTEYLRADVDRLGPVRHLVSPNKLHHLHLKEWKAAYPDAALWGPRSTIKKRPDLSFHEPPTESPPREWHPDIDQTWFRGSFAMDEIVFFHPPSGTAIVADLIQTFSDRFLRKHWGWWRFLARLDGLTQDQTCAPRERRYSAGIVSASSSRTASGCEPTGMHCSRSHFVGSARDGYFLSISSAELANVTDPQCL